jgi:hypothetical protein
MMGKVRLQGVTSLMSLIQPWWDSTLLALYSRKESVNGRHPLAGCCPGTYKTNQLHTTLVELGLQLREGTKLGGACGSEVILSKIQHRVSWEVQRLCFRNQNGEKTHRVGEENDIVVADELVEVDLALVGLSLEVGGSRAETDAVEMVW